MKPSLEDLLALHGPQPAPYSGGPSVASTTPFHRQRSRSEGYRQREKRLRRNGYHPSGCAPLHADATLRCKGCISNVLVPNSTGELWRPKCQRLASSWTPGRASDCLPSWPACTRYEARPLPVVPPAAGTRNSATGALDLVRPDAAPGDRDSCCAAGDRGGADD